MVARNRPPRRTAGNLARPPTWAEAEERARHYLDLLGRGDHPDARDNPVYALYQVAIDFRCTAEGYRSLYLHSEGAPKPMPVDRAPPAAPAQALRNE